MSPTSLQDRIERRRKENADALAAFGDVAEALCACMTIREGSGPTVFTIGYEKRDGDDLIAALRDAGVEVLLDVRERPMSRKPDFRRSALEAACDEAGIRYESWPRLGSTGHQREQLKDTRDFSLFRKRFRELMVRSRATELDQLARFVEQNVVALICYEREHSECHRSVIADLLHDEIDASVVAIR